MKTVEIQTPLNNIDCPMSGWSIRRIITEHNNKKLDILFDCFVIFLKLRFLQLLK